MGPLTPQMLSYDGRFRLVSMQLEIGTQRIFKEKVEVILMAVTSTVMSSALHAARYFDNFMTFSPTQHPSND